MKFINPVANQDYRILGIEAIPAPVSNPAGLNPAAFTIDRTLWESGRSPTILVVDNSDVSRRLLRAMLRTEPYHIVEAGRASEAVIEIETQPVDLIILDLMLPETNGVDFCRWLKSNRKTQFVPVLIITSVQGVENEIMGLSAGADEFLLKPLSPALVRTRIQSLLRHKAAVDSLEEAETILFALAQAIEQRDKNTGDHCQRIATYSVALGMALGLSRPELVALYRGGYLHDIGKIAVPDHILFKRGQLTEEEWVVMRSHTTKGEEICRPMKSLGTVLPIIRNHHERWDGTGYPDCLRGEQIPLLARILQIADVYDALTSERSYKRAFPHAEAMQMIQEESTRGWRDPALVALFEELCSRASVAKPSLPPPPEWPDASPMQISLHNMSRALLQDKL
ncbi:MAG: putative cyclic di-GMP phosphodiesterase [Bryobacteraceae bacterium]|nr:putative cyclic di-GMP phosphodiesterase [Bryobacteraceae bacterium]